MNKTESVRIDKYLWAVRLFKTRSLAAEACKKGRVTIDEQPVKSSRMIRREDKISIKVPPAVKTYKVLDLSEKRMGAKLVPDFLEDITPKEELDLLDMARMTQKLSRPKGTGRPTKKDRRDLDNLKNDLS
ncbi:RNA-binding S4 domain-containing protein [Marinilabilia salmonicolor]|uniref:RNA-binding S4 domain-containing protein n=1 Tax=Marinilabilia salmonicolor TaxID=989 RepID=UPI00029A95C8|nr:S4 domain-containing protein [Marinilabilia salmonicolor]